MKKLFIALTALGCATLLPLSSASATCVGELRYLTPCIGCGGPVYARYQVVGCSYDGCPRYGWVMQVHNCSPRPSCHPPQRSKSHHHRHHKKHHRH